MARTRRAAAADPKHDTTDSRKQLKNTRPAREGRTGPLRAKRARSKKTGRLDEVDHDHRLEVARSVRQRLALDAPRAVEVVEAPAVPNDGAADEPEPDLGRETKNEKRDEARDDASRRASATSPRGFAAPNREPVRGCAPGAPRDRAQGRRGGRGRLRRGRREPRLRARDQGPRRRLPGRLGVPRAAGVKKEEKKRQKENADAATNDAVPRVTTGKRIRDRETERIAS